MALYSFLSCNVNLSSPPSRKHMYGGWLLTEISSKQDCGQHSQYILQNMFSFGNQNSVTTNTRSKQIIVVNNLIVFVLTKCCFCLRDDFEDKIASLLLRLEATLKALLEKSGNDL